MVLMIVSSSYGIPLAYSKVNININNSNTNSNSNTNNDFNVNDICKKVSAICKLMNNNNNDNDVFEISIGNSMILCRSLCLLNGNSNNQSNIYIIFYYQYDNDVNITSRFKLYSLYIGYIVIMILNEDIKKHYTRMQQNIDDNINSSTFHSIVSKNDNNSDNDFYDNDDIFINLEDHFLSKVLYVLLSNSNNDNDNSNIQAASCSHVINWLIPMCKSIPEVSAIDTAYIYSVNCNGNDIIKLSQEYLHCFGANSGDGANLNETWELALSSYYYYCKKNIDNSICVQYIQDGTIIHINNDNEQNKQSLLVALIQTDTNAKLLLVIKLPHYILHIDKNDNRYTGYYILSSLDSLPIQLLQCWKECLFRLKKAFISKQSIYYVARAINDSIETYDTILKNCSSISDYYKLIPIPPKTPTNNETSIKRPGRKITTK